jgi:hypothetical protein
MAFGEHALAQGLTLARRIILPPIAALDRQR